MGSLGEEGLLLWVQSFSFAITILFLFLGKPEHAGAQFCSPCISEHTPWVKVCSISAGAERYIPPVFFGFS